MQFKPLTLNLQDVDRLSIFYQQLSHTFGFPEFFGNNLDAAIDCLSSLYIKEEGLTNICLQQGEYLLLKVIGLSCCSSKIQRAFLTIIEATQEIWDELNIDGAILLYLHSTTDGDAETSEEELNIIRL